MKRAVALAVLVLLTAVAVRAVVTWQPPDRSRCAHLIAQSQLTPDVAAEIEAARCVDPAASPGHDLTARP